MISMSHQMRKWVIKHPTVAEKCALVLKILSWAALFLAFVLWLFGDHFQLSAWQNRAEPISVLAAALLSLSTRIAAAIARVKPLDRIEETKTLRVGYPHYPPFISSPSNQDQPPTGIFAELITKVAEDKKWKIAWIPLQFCETIDAIQSRRVDLVACLFKTPARDEVCDFAALLFDVLVVGLKRKGDDRIRELPDLQKPDVRVLVCEGEIGHEEAVHTFAIPRERLQVYRGPLDAFASLIMDEKADVLLMDALSCQTIIEKGNNPANLEIVFQEGIARAHTGFMLESGQPEFREFLDKKIRAAYQQERSSNSEEIPRSPFTRNLM
jgi:ABC-type amino acid transport substrate-binding protein